MYSKIYITQISWVIEEIIIFLRDSNNILCHCTKTSWKMLPSL